MLERLYSWGKSQWMTRLESTAVVAMPAAGFIGGMAYGLFERTGDMSYDALKAIGHGLLYGYGIATITGLTTLMTVAFTSTRRYSRQRTEEPVIERARDAAEMPAATLDSLL